MHASISGHLYSQSASLGKNPKSLNVSLFAAVVFWFWFWFPFIFWFENVLVFIVLLLPPLPPPIPIPTPAVDPVLPTSNCWSKEVLVREISNHVNEMSPGSFRIGSRTNVTCLFGEEKEIRWITYLFCSYFFYEWNKLSSWMINEERRKSVH